MLGYAPRMEPKIEEELPSGIPGKRTVENLDRNVEIDFSACSGDAHLTRVIACRRRLRNVEGKPHYPVALGRPQLRLRIETIADEIVFVEIRTVLRLRSAHETGRKRPGRQMPVARGCERRCRHLEFALMDVAPYRHLRMDPLPPPSCKRNLFRRRSSAAYGRRIYALVKAKCATVQSIVEFRRGIGTGQERPCAQHTCNHQHLHHFSPCFQIPQALRNIPLRYINSNNSQYTAIYSNSPTKAPQSGGNSDMTPPKRKFISIFHGNTVRDAK